MLKLRPDTWINDEIINAFMAILQKESDSQEIMFMNTFFYEILQSRNIPKIERAFKKMKRKIIKRRPIPKFVIPVNVSGNHWVLVKVIVKWGSIMVYDSMSDVYPKGQCEKIAEPIIHFLKNQKSCFPEYETDSWEVTPMPCRQ
jgi:Ulp1 family protease